MVSREVLQRNPVFADLSLAKIDDLASTGELIAVNKGDWIYHEGDIANFLYYLLGGAIELRLSHRVKQVQHETISTLTEPGDIFGWCGLLEPHKYLLCAFAAEDSAIIGMNTDRVIELIEGDNDLGFIFSSNLAKVMSRRMHLVHDYLVSDERA